MKYSPKKSIEFKFGLLILFIGLMQNALLIWMETHRIRQNLLEEMQLNLKATLVAKQQTLTFLFLNQRPEQIQQAVTSLGANPHVQGAYLLAPDNTVIAATRVDALNLNISTQLPEAIYASLLEQLRHKNTGLKIHQWHHEPSDSLLAFIPVELGRSSEQLLRNDQYAILFVWLDTNWIDTRTNMLLHMHVLPMGGLILLAVLVLLVIFHFTIIKRLRRINDAATRFSLGVSYMAETDRGEDELSTLNRSLENFTWQINTQYEDLRSATLQLHQQQTEQQYILDTMLDAVVTIDEHGSILSFNSTAEQMFGYSVNDVAGRNVSMLMPEAIARQHDGYIEAYLHGGPPKIIGIGREVTGQRKNGEQFPMRLAVAELPRQASSPRRFVGTCQDISQEKQQHELLRQSQKMDALGKLTGGVAHDFNNMLGVILGYAELLRSSVGLQPKQEKYIQEIYNAGERAKNLTAKLLAFSRKSSAEVSVIDINRLLLDQKDVLEKTLTVRIQLVLNTAKDLWPVELDKSALTDAILNMAINAMHAMPEGGQLTITTGNMNLSGSEAETLHLPAGDYVLLEIDDNGIGMDEDTRQKIFDPFFTTKGMQGTGLGMSQVYGFVKSAKGLITVQSAPGQGANFRLYFPRHRGEIGSDSSSAPSGMNNSQGKGRILIVDDEAALASLAQEILQHYGYRVMCAGQAQEALALLQQHSVDLVLSDIVMPGMDGYQLAAKIRELYPHIKIQLASGYSDGRVIHNQSDLQQSLLRKPYTTSALLEAVRALLEGDR